jgi:hypothetical protein
VQEKGQCQYRRACDGAGRKFKSFTAGTPVLLVQFLYQHGLKMYFKLHPEIYQKHWCTGGAPAMHLRFYFFFCKFCTSVVRFRCGKPIQYGTVTLEQYKKEKSDTDPLTNVLS